MEFYDQKNNKYQNWNQSKTYILCIPYTKNPDSSFSRTVNITRYLRKEKGVVVFSPILHTHSYDLSLKTQNLEYNEDYYEWDLALYDALSNNAIMIFTEDYKESKGCVREMNWAIKKALEIIYVKE
jgi:hypothetical protein